MARLCALPPHAPVTLRRPAVTPSPLLMSANSADMPAPLGAAGAAGLAAAGACCLSSRLPGPPGGSGGGGGGPPAGLLGAAGALGAAAAAGTAAGAGAAAAGGAGAAAPGLNCDTGTPLAFQVGPWGKCCLQKSCKRTAEGGRGWRDLGRRGLAYRTPYPACLENNPTHTLDQPALSCCNPNALMERLHSTHPPTHPP